MRSRAGKVFVLLVCVFLGSSTSFAQGVLTVSQPFASSLALGAEGSEVTLLQRVLQIRGYYTYPEITGYFGTITEDAVIAFQTMNDIPATGYVGPLTLLALNGETPVVNASPSSKPSAIISTPVTPATTVVSTPIATSIFTGSLFTLNLSVGSEGTQVSELQTFLADEGFFTYPTITGYYGAVTADAVTVFQKEHNIDPIGIVGPMTRQAINAIIESNLTVPPTTTTSTATTTTTKTTTTTTVSGGSGGGGGGGGGGAPSTPADTTPPSVSLTAPAGGSTVSGTSVTISADASDNVAVADVQFEIDALSLSSEVTSAPYSISWDSTQLADGTYTLAAVAEDTSGNYATSTEMITVDNTPPAISAISSGTPSQTSATITWITDTAASSVVNYGTTSSYGSATSSAAFVTSHSLTIIGLSSSTTYYYQVVSTDNYGNTATSSEMTFTTSAPSECPQGDSYSDDGCAALYTGGLQGTVQYADMFTNTAYAPGSGQTYTSIAPWNKAGVDYPVGVPASYSASLLDPAVDPPTRCTYSATGSSYGGPKLTCANGAVSIIGYEFGPTGGHEATVLHMNNTVTSLTIEDSDFQNDVNTFNSSNANDYALYLATPGSTDDITFDYNTINGECQSSDCSLGNYQIVLYTTGAVTWQYDAWLNQPIRPTAGCDGACATVGDLNVEYNLLLGFEITDGTHGEILEQVFATTGTPSTQNNTDYEWNTIVQPATAIAGYTTALIYVSGGSAPVGPPTYSDVNVSNNTLVCNQNDGSSVCSSLVDFINGVFPNVTIENNYLDATGAIGTFESEGNEANFTGSIAVTTGVLTVTGWSGHLITDNQQLWYGGAASGITITSQLGGTTGENGTYQTSTTSPVSSQAMVSYGTQGDAVFVNAPLLSGNVNMVTGVSHNTFDYVYQTNVPLPPLSAPVLSSIISDATSTAATITWTTDIAASSTVEYGTTPSYGLASTSASFVTSHSITLTDLTASTTYHYRVDSANTAGTVATSSDMTFVTPGLSSTLCPKGTGLSDLGGTSDNCADATSNGSYQWATFFTDARQSEQLVYTYNDSTLDYNIPCIDNTCGYDTTLLTFDPQDESFTATTSSISSGVLLVDTSTLGIGGEPYVGQTLSGTGITANTTHITSQIDSTHWQTDNGSLTVGTETISGEQHPQLNCIYQTSWIPTYGYDAPAIHCNTTTDTTDATTFSGYDMSLHGGVILYIYAGGGTSGDAGSVTITDSKFTCNTTTEGNSITTGVGTHFDLYITHDQFDGGYPTCTGGETISNNTVGTSGQYQTLDIEWNAFLNEPDEPGSGVGNYTNIIIANNMFAGFDLTGAYHGAVYANSLAAPMGSYTYEHNTCLYPSTSPSEEGTTCYSLLANASSYINAAIGAVSFLGNIAVANLAGGYGGTYTAQCILWENVDPISYSSLTSRGNLSDPTGALGNCIYHGGQSRNASTAYETASSSLTTITVTSMSDDWPVNSYVHVNTTPYTWSGKIIPNGDGTGTMTVDGSGIGTLAAGNGVAGILVPPGMYITAKNSNTSYTVKNYYGTSDADLTAPDQALYSVCTLLAYGTIDPQTGLPSTGTGQNTGTYIAACQQTDISRTTYHRYNPTIGTYPPDVNNGTDKYLTTGESSNLGGKDWSEGVATP